MIARKVWYPVTSNTVQANQAKNDAKQRLKICYFNLKCWLTTHNFLLWIWVPVNRAAIKSLHPSQVHKQSRGAHDTRSHTFAHSTPVPPPSTTTSNCQARGTREKSNSSPNHGGFPYRDFTGVYDVSVAEAGGTRWRFQLMPVHTHTNTQLSRISSAFHTFHGCQMEKLDSLPSVLTAALNC